VSDGRRAKGGEFLPCPFCGESEDLVSASHPVVDGWAVSCGSCGSSSFAIETDDDEFDEAEAIKRWNTRAPALAWASEPPAVPGWYWARHPLVLGLVMVPVGPEDIGRGEFKPGSQWAGPIPEPEE